MRKIVFVIILFSFSSFSFSQSNYKRFKKLFEKNDTTGIKNLLVEWEKTNPNDPDFYASRFTYYFSISKKEVISINKEKRSTEGFELTDKKGKVAGFMSSDIGYDPNKLKVALQYGDQAIEKFPARLDIRFGKCFVLKETHYYEGFTKEVLKTIDYSKKINSNWLWTENEKLEDGEGFLLNGIYDYQKQLYETEDDNLLDYLKQIGDEAIKYYPKKVEILSITSVANIIANNYDKAIEYLLQAEKINPKDFIVLNNIAQAYNAKGDKTNAIKYYELSAKYGDEDAKQQSKEKIKELKKQ